MSKAIDRHGKPMEFTEAGKAQCLKLGISPGGYMSALEFGENFIAMAHGDVSEKRLMIHVTFLGKIGDLEQAALAELKRRIVKSN